MMVINSQLLLIFVTFIATYSCEYVVEVTRHSANIVYDIAYPTPVNDLNHSYVQMEDQALMLIAVYTTDFSMDCYVHYVCRECLQVRVYCPLENL